MADKSGLVAIVVALIGAAGVVGAKWLDTSGKPAPIVADARPAPTPVVQPPPPVAAEKSAEPIPQPTNVAVVSPPPAAPPAIAGTWIDAGGIAYRVTQSGATFEMNSSFNGARVTAQGAILGRELRWTYQNSLNNPGQCVGQLQPGDAMVTAGCQQQNGAPYMIQFARAG